jgi:hypothetical protein
MPRIQSFASVQGGLMRSVARRPTITFNGVIGAGGGFGPGGVSVPLWTPALLPVTALLPVYNLTLSGGRLTNALGRATDAGSVDGTYRASGPRGLPAVDLGQDGASIAMPGPNVAAGYYVLADFDGYTQDAGVTANGVSGQPGDYGFLWDGKYDRTDQNPRPFFFLKHNGYSGYPFIQAGTDTSALTPFAFPTEAAIALVLRYGADGTGWMDANGDRSATKTGIGTVGIRGGFVIGSPGTEGATTPRIQIRQFRVLLDNYPNALADALRWQGWSAWQGGYQRQLHPSHPYRFGPPLADGTARAPLSKPGTARRRSVYVGYASTAPVQTWATAMALTRPTIANDHGDFSSWANMLSSGQNVANVWSAAGYTDLVMTVPIAVAGVSLAASAGGSGDSETTTLINTYKTKFVGRRVYRLGHEPNVSRFPWSPAYSGAGTVADYLSAYARKVAVVRAADPAGLIAWNPATGFNDIAWTSLIPPAAQIDIVGIDGYNQSKGGAYDNMVGWSRYLANVLNPARLGAEQLVLLAEKLGKPWAIYEYGTGCGGTGAAATYPQNQGGDDPNYPGYVALTMRGGSGVTLGYAEQPCVDDCPYEITDSGYSSRTYLAQPPQTSAPTDARDQKPSAAAAFKAALAA